MKKYIFITFFIINYAYSQNGLIRYGYIDAKAIGNAKGDDSNAYMVFNKEQSYFVTAKDSLENASTKNDTQVFENDNDDTGGHISMGKKVSAQGDQVAYHIKKNTMWSNILYVNHFYVKEVAPEQNWKIEKETKKIGKFNCKKATTFFRGRNYTAWFTTEIALPFGPWKLHGLPGLILEAYEKDKKAYWYFKSVEYPSKTKETAKYISIPKGLKWLTYQDFKKAQKEQIQKAEDRNKVIDKQIGVQSMPPELKLMFLECE